MKQLISLFFFLSLFYNAGTQTLSFESTFYEYDLLEWADNAVIADLDGDDLPDFVISWETQNKLYVGLNNQLSKPDFVLIEEVNSIRGLTLVDLDLDGDLDIVGAAPFADASFWWENDGAAKFTRKSLSIGAYQGICFADLDRDDQLEAVISIDRGLHIYKNDNGSLTRQSTLFEDFFGDDSPAIQVFNNNGDDLMDIVATFNRNGIIVYQQTGSLNFETIEVADNVLNQSSLFVTDINRDGAIDFISHSDFNGNTSLIMNNNNGSYTTSILPRDLSRNEFTSVGDIDGDGDDDILYYEETSTSISSLSVLINNEGAFTKALLSDEHSKIETGGIADLDADGDKDIMVFSNRFFAEGMVVFENTSAISTALVEEKRQRLNIFPNVSASSFRIEAEGLFTYSVVDAYGKEVARGESFEETSIWCSEWHNGVYFISVKQKGIMQTNKVMKVN